MLARLTAVLGAAAAIACVPAAAAHASDASVTESYLRANLALVTAGHNHLSSSIAGYRGVLTHVRSSCPHAAIRSPQNPESTQLSNEVIGAMVLSAGNPDRPAIATFLRAVRGMRWSSASVTHAVSSYASMLAALYKLSVPDLCGDVGKWAASGYTALPASTLSFVKVFYPNWVALGLLPPGIGRFESGSARGIARRAEGYERQLTDTEATAVETYGAIMDTLELNP
jgi:hypothetical protein